MMTKNQKIGIAVGVALTAIGSLWYFFIRKPGQDKTSDTSGAGSVGSGSVNPFKPTSGSTGTVVKPPAPKGIYVEYDNQKVYGYNYYKNQVIMDNTFIAKKGYYVGLLWKEDPSFYIGDKNGVKLAILKANAELK